MTFTPQQQQSHSQLTVARENVRKLAKESEKDGVKKRELSLLLSLTISDVCLLMKKITFRA